MTFLASESRETVDRRPLIAHVIFRLDWGGLENGLVNLLNHLPGDRFRHTVICLTDYTDFRRRVRRPDVSFHSLNKPPGNSLATHMQMIRLLKRLKPTIVHTRNLAALEHQVDAMIAGSRIRIHSEHGRNADDVDGSNWKHLAVRRVLRNSVQRYVALSRDLEHYLVHRIGVSPVKITRICNGVDTDRFAPAGAREAIGPAGFADADSFVIGSVGRMDPVKDPLNLVRAFVAAIDMAPEVAPKLRLVMVGDGQLRADALRMLNARGVARQAWLPGALDDIPRILRGLDLFALPSMSEGISNTILEAMASGIPVLATAVGGNIELLDDGVTGTLVPRSDFVALARAMLSYARQPDLRLVQARRAREEALARFSLPVMVAAYASLYESQLTNRRRRTDDDRATAHAAHDSH